MNQIVLNGVLYKKGDNVVLSSEYGQVTGKIYDIGNWIYKRPDKSEYTKPYVHVEYDREGLFGIKECWLWTDEHFKTMSHQPAGCCLKPGVGWVVNA